MPHLYGLKLSRAELLERTGRLEQIGGITELSFGGGRARGVRGIRVETGRLCVEFVADRALDIVRASCDGVPFVWRSANDLAAPSFYEPHGDEWLRSFFGGWLTTCGLSNFGPAGTDRWGEFGLHGRIDNLPVEELSATTRWDGERCTFEIAGTIRETKALGVKLALHRRWSTELGSTTLRLEDRVVNESGNEWPHMILYHCNAGFPLLGADTKVYVSHSSVEPRDAQAQVGLPVWDRGGEPEAGFAEQVFIHTPVPCADGKARAAIVRPQLRAGAGLGFEIAFDPAELPALFSWRKLDVGDYVMSVEPANTRAIQGRAFAEGHGLLPTLAPGAQRRYSLDFSVLTGIALKESIATIRNTQGG